MRQYITQELVEEAKAMLEDGRDYFPSLRNGVPFGVTHGLPEELMLYNYGDSVWLVAHNDECDMEKATKLLRVCKGANK